MRVKSGAGLVWSLTVPSEVGEYSRGAGRMGWEEVGERQRVCIRAREEKEEEWQELIF